MYGLDDAIFAPRSTLYAQREQNPTERKANKKLSGNA